MLSSTYGGESVPRTLLDRVRALGQLQYQDRDGDWVDADMQMVKDDMRFADSLPVRDRIRRRAMTRIRDLEHGGRIVIGRRSQFPQQWRVKPEERDDALDIPAFLSRQAL